MASVDFVRFTLSHGNPQAVILPAWLQSFISSPPSEAVKVTNTPIANVTSANHIQIAIVGSGPRGISTLERLLASAPELHTSNLTDAQLTVHVIDPWPPGPGRVWRTDQPPNLLMNTPACQVTLFTDETVTCSGPIRPGPNLYEWSSQNNMEINPDDYLTRSQHGCYLAWFFGKILEGVPTNVNVQVHTAIALSLDDEPSGLQTLTLSNGQTISGLSAIILALGHLPLLPSPSEQSLVTYAEQHGLHYFRPSSPADVNLSPINPDEQVLLRGLGLCFFDYLSLLTTGRGGKFETTEYGLRYIRSGYEPLLYAGSRRGIPYHARGDKPKGVSGRRIPVHLTSDIVALFRKRVDASNPLDFMNDIWPLISKEVELAYYECLVGQENTEFHNRFLAAQQEKTHTDAQAYKIKAQVLDDFNVPTNKRWSWDRLSQPQGGRNFTAFEWESWLIAYLRSDVEEAILGNVHGPLKAALNVMRDLRNDLREIIDHNGLSGHSHRNHLDKWYTPLNAFLSIGPPRQRIQEMIALIEAGVLVVLGPELSVREEDGAWLAQSPKVLDLTVRVTTLIEARLPRPNLKHTADKLLTSLLQKGQCRPHTIDGYETGGLDVTRSPYNLIDSQGRAHKRRFALGIPTEGVHWITAATAKPDANSALLRKTDAVARAALCCGRADVEN
ncbi:hypothetical protein GL218_00705 [Daldinia childiae]|uniref:uncharacterized protein n=1 Tax=Daldinia childiae TaxID=326645 RepID=UPI001444DF7E|nr:uncharacterized protein GL218_00705 [Daldinia childiae]KAF3071036.1 hypothetical protein GL218_00705 [Daldinia childiae]